MLRSWFERVGDSLAVTAALPGSVIELDPIGTMIGAFRGAVDPCALDLVPQIRTDKAIIQPQAMAGGAARRIGPPGDAVVIAELLSCDRPAIDEAVQMLYLTVDRVEDADHPPKFLAFGLAVEITHHDCLIGHRWLGFAVGPLETDETLVPVHGVESLAARPGTPVRPRAPVPCEQIVDLQEPIAGGARGEMDRIDPQRPRGRVDHTLDSARVHIEVLHRSQLWKHDDARGEYRPARKHHGSELPAPIEHRPVIVAFAGVHIERGTIDPVEFLQVPAENIGLVKHAAPFPTPLDLLHADDVGVAHRFGDALEIDSVVGAQSKTNIVADELHSVLREAM